MPRTPRTPEQALKHRIRERERCQQNREEWFAHIPALRVDRGEVIHHMVENFFARMFFKVFGRVDRNPDRPSIKAMANYINFTPYTFWRGVRVRIELFFCKTLSRSEHCSLHHALGHLK